MSKIIIVGGGAAGMMASIFTAKNGHEVHIYEKNEKLGKKLFITGKGRCNITNACDMQELLDGVISNSKFLYSAFYGYTNQDVISFFESLGVKTKIERGNRIFPMSDHSSDVIRAMEREMKSVGVKVHLKSPVKKIQYANGKVTGITLTNEASISGDAIIIATGGVSYPSTGSTGDGYEFAKSAGHKVRVPIPSLVPMETKEPYITKLQGLSLKNVSLSIKDGKKLLYEAFGEMLFTHFGITGPLVLTASAYLGEKALEKELQGTIDLKPAVSAEQLDIRILREFREGSNKQFKNVIQGLLPAKLIPVIIELSQIPPEKKVNEISRVERMQFIEKLKAFPITITGLRDFNEAIITKGGVRVNKIHPGTMESKLVNGLYFIGEVLDLDAITGGFNLQIAWSTAYACAYGIETEGGAHNGCDCN